MVLLGFGSGFMCFDTCPPDLLEAMIRLTALCLVPGALLTSVAWLLALITMNRASHPGHYLLVLIFPPAMLVLGVVILLILHGGWLLPTNET